MWQIHFMKRNVCLVFGKKNKHTDGKSGSTEITHIVKVGLLKDNTVEKVGLFKDNAAFIKNVTDSEPPVCLSRKERQANKDSRYS